MPLNECLVCCNFYVLVLIVIVKALELEARHTFVQTFCKLLFSYLDRSTVVLCLSKYVQYAGWFFVCFVFVF